MNVVGIAGSLRQGSYNKLLLNAAVKLAPAGMMIEVFDRLREIPPFDQDQEKDPPEVVRDLKGRIASAGGLLLATPEYNYGIPGVLKNAIDWVSRPYGDPTLLRKPVAIMGAAPGNFGTVRAQLALRQLFLWTHSDVLVKPEVMVFLAQERFDENGNLKDKGTLDLVTQFLAAFKRHIEVNEHVRDLHAAEPV